MTQVLYILFADVISLVFLASLATGLFWPILGWVVFFPWCISIGLLYKDRL